MIIPETAYSNVIEKGLNVLSDSDSAKNLVSNHDELVSASLSTESALCRIKKDYKSPFVFSRIVERGSDSGRYLFGSKIKVRKFKEFQICSAKMVDGEWKPDVDKVLAAFSITDEMMSSVVLKTGDASGFPVTVSNFLGQEFAQPTTPFIESNKQYTSMIDSKDAKGRDAVCSLLDKCEDLLINGGRISKEDKLKLKGYLSAIMRYLNDDNNYDLELLVEHLEKDSVSIYSDVISNINAALRNTSVSERPRLEDKSSKGSSDLETVLDFFLGENTSVKINELISDLKTVMMIKDKEKYSEGLSLGNKIHNMHSFFNSSGYSSNRGKLFNKTNALLRMSSGSSGRSKFFGNSKYVPHYVTFNLSWGYVKCDDFGSFNFSDHISMLKIAMTPVQYLELMQGVGTDLWVRTSLERYLGFESDESEYEDVEYDKVPKPKVEDVDSAKSLLRVVNEMSELISSSGQAKAKRVKLVELAEKVKEQFEIIVSDRREQFIQEGAKVKSVVIDNQMKDIVQAVETIASKRPDIKDEFESILTNDVYRLGK